MNFAGTMKPYRIGWSKHGRKWWRLGLDRWQSECPDVCRFARRGATPAMALRRMERDVAAALQGRQTAHQRWKQWRARKWDAENLTPEALGTDG